MTTILFAMTTITNCLRHESSIPTLDQCMEIAVRECASQQHQNEAADNECLEILYVTCLTSSVSITASDSLTPLTESQGIKKTSETYGSAKIDALVTDLSPLDTSEISSPVMFFLNRVIGRCSNYRIEQVPYRQRVCHGGHCVTLQYTLPQKECLPL